MEKPCLTQMNTVEVVAAIIQFHDTYLCLQRGQNKYDYISHKFEFPGGKIEDGESNEQALKREIFEELNVNLTTLTYFGTVQHQYPDFSIVMHAYLSKVDTDKITLTEHIAETWLKAEKLHELDWAAADIPFVDKLQKSVD